MLKIGSVVEEEFFVGRRESKNVTYVQKKWACLRGMYCMAVSGINVTQRHEFLTLMRVLANFAHKKLCKTHEK